MGICAPASPGWLLVHLDLALAPQPVRDLDRLVVRVLCEMEAALPELERLITREYNELYGGGQPDKSKLIHMTGRERTLTTIFMVLYVVFALGVVWTLLR